MLRLAIRPGPEIDFECGSELRVPCGTLSFLKQENVLFLRCGDGWEKTLKYRGFGETRVFLVW